MRALGLLLVAVLGASEAHAARMKKAMVIPPRTTGGKGAVRYVSSMLAFLDRGAADGLTAGRELSFTRSGRVVGSCVVDVVEQHFATCITDKLKKGDRFSFPRMAELPPPGPPVALSSPEMIAARRQTLLAATPSLVDFRAQEEDVALHHVWVALGSTGYGNFVGTGGPFALTRLDATARDVELWGGLKFSADLSVYSSSDRTVPYRSPMASVLMVQLRQLELEFRRPDVPFSAALGRVWLRDVPGLLVLDGAQAAFRPTENVQLGAYGGLLPDGLSLAIAPDQLAVGAFGSVRAESGHGDDALVGMAALRAGYAVRTQLGARFEVGAAGHLYSGKALDAHASADVGLGLTPDAISGVDGARVDVGWRPLDALSLSVSGRYRGLSPSAVWDLGVVSPGRRAVHADVLATYGLGAGVLFGLTAGGAVDVDGGAMTQGRAGPELAFPALFGRYGGVSFAYAEELGWLRGRSASAQVTLLGLGLVRITSRTTWFQQDASGDLVSDLGESVFVEVRPSEWMWIRGSASARTALDPTNDGSRTAGLASLQVGGQF
jgi:hypothetical protein